MFRTDCKKVYNLLRQKNINVKNAPTKEEVENFWKEIFEKKVQHNDTAYWMKNQCQKNPSIEWSPVLRKTLQSKGPGRDQTANFWLKQLTATHIFSNLL